MKIDVITFSKCGAELAGRMIESLGAHGNEMKGFIARRHGPETGFEPFASVRALAAQLFDDTDALVFVGACGIAVRAVAPLVKSKLADPAVVVCDETGRFSISLLSGHAGGANQLAGQIAEIIGATPVVTTASDAHAFLDGKEEPRNLVLGIGCRRGLSAENIERAATILLWDKKIPLARVCEVATIDVKRNDEGLLGFVKAHKLPLRFYSAEELSAVQGEFSTSEMVLWTVGVDNVCERAAVLCGAGRSPDGEPLAHATGGNGKLIMKKTAKDGVTVAVFERECESE